MSKKITPFEQIRRTNPAGNEFWSSRDFARVLGCANYRHFQAVIEKARTACFNSGQQVEDHFVGADQMVEIGYDFCFVGRPHKEPRHSCRAANGKQKIRAKLPSFLPPLAKRTRVSTLRPTPPPLTNSKYQPLHLPTAMPVSATRCFSKLANALSAFSISASQLLPTRLTISRLIRNQGEWASLGWRSPAKPPRPHLSSSSPKHPPTKHAAPA